MRWLGRLLGLLFGLLWRLVVLLLFEKWLPLPEHGAPEQATPVAPRAARGEKKRAGDEAQRAGAPRPAARTKRAEQPRAFFAAESSEWSPELAAQREGEHWLKAGRARPLVRAGAPRESLAGLLRDPRGLREAVVLGAALGARNPRS